MFICLTIEEKKSTEKSFSGHEKTNFFYNENLGLLRESLEKLSVFLYIF